MILHVPSEEKEKMEQVIQFFQFHFKNTDDRKYTPSEAIRHALYRLRTIVNLSGKEVQLPAPIIFSEEVK